MSKGFKEDGSASDWLTSGGEMGERTRKLDWSKTPVGPIERWPQSLKSAVSFLLPSKAQIVLFWGPELVTFYNDAYRPVFGAKHPHVLGLPAREAWSELWEKGLSELLEGVVHTGEAYWASDRPFFIERHGFLEESLFDVSYDPVRDETGRVGGVFCIVSETTSRVLAARRMQTLRELSSRTAENAGSVERACTVVSKTLAEHPEDLPFTLLYLLDEAGQRATLSGLSGVKPGTKASPPIVDLNDPAALWPFGEVVARGHVIEVNDLLRRFGALPGGLWPEPPALARILPIAKPGQAKLAGFLVAGASPRLAFNEEYRGFLDLIAGHVGTAIANARAFEEEKERSEALAELDRAKTAFFSNVSHEFRTPLTLILGPLDDALGDAEKSLSRDRLKLVHRNALRLQKLVNALLDFSRIEAGRVEVSYEATDLGGLTSDLASVFRSAIESADMKLIVDSPKLSDPVFVDRDMWEKIVLNLLSNAFKFTHQGEIEVRLRDVGSMVELSVRDTGVGIAKDDLPKVFNRFHRIEGVRSRTHEGTGIGLALVKELVALHGGAVEVESEEGHGATFRVSIPKGHAHLPSDRIGASRELSSTSHSADHFVNEASRWLGIEEDGNSTEGGLGTQPEGLTRPKILWADDNSDMRDYVRNLLSPYYDVECVSDSVAALSAVDRTPPDLVLADVMMPGLDGFGLLHALRSNEKTREIPVVLLSARSGEEARVEGMEAGANDYITKPFSARELTARVSAHLEQARKHKDAERARRDSEVRFRLFADAAPAILWVTEPDGRASFLSRGWFDFTGQMESAASGFGWLDAVHPDDREHFREILFRALKQHELFELEYRLCRYDGEYRWAMNAGRPLFGFGGELVSFVGSVIDIHERKEAEQKVRRSEQHLELLSNTVPALISYLDQNRCYRSCNEAYSKWFGLPHSRIIGHPIREVVGEKAWAVIEPRIEAAFAGETVEFQSEVDYRHGGIRWIHAIYTPHRESNGGVIGVVVLVTDITAIKQAEHTRARLAAIIDSSDDAIVSKDLKGVVTSWNSGASRLFGYSPEEMVGQSITILIPEERFHEEADILERVGRGEHIRHFETVRRRKDGTLVDISLAISPIIDEEGKIIGVSKIARDIIARKNAEKQLRIMAEERQAMLEGERAARSQAEHAGRMKDEFLATLSHELRTPLNAILGYAMLLNRERDANEEVKEAAQTIERNARMQAQLIEDLLDMNRIISGRIRLEMRRIVLPEIVEEATKTVRPSAEARGVHIEVLLGSVDFPMKGDPGRIQQILWNLLSNAIKFTSRGGKVQVVLERVDSDVKVVVRDTGIGISPEFLPYVFDRFRQEDGSITRRHGGLGLGLAIVKHLVELHGGTIDVASPGEGLGSTFTVVLPLSVALDSEAPGTALASTMADSSQLPTVHYEIDLSGVRVLAVDDEADATRLVKRVLNECGAEVSEARSVEDAILQLSRAQFDVLVSDIGMPGEDGYSLIRRVRSLEGDNRSIPAIALTAFARSEDRRRAAVAGFQTHLSKPVEASELVAVVGNLAGRIGGGGSLGTV